MHRLPGTLKAILSESSHTDLSVLLRTSQRDPRSLQSYWHLRGGEGLKQQRDLCGIFGWCSKRSFLNEAVLVTERPKENSQIGNCTTMRSIPFGGSSLQQNIFSNIFELKDTDIHTTINNNEDSKSE